jgi:exonuclease SbcC
MIKEIDIVNFQSHKSSHLELVPGVNVIVGASDSGKSAIIRALRWLIWNRPVGDAFLSHWGGLTTVNVTMENGITIERSKGKTVNVYALIEYDTGSEFEEFKAFGNDVPQPIQEILNLDETNLQRQGDQPFLISNTPGEVSSYFNKVAKLDQIDTSLKFITSNAKALTGQIKSAEVRLQSLETESERYQYLGKAEAQLEVLEEDLLNQYHRRSGLQTLRELHAGITYLENLNKLDQEIVDREEVVDELLDMIAQRSQVLEAKTSLTESVTSWTILETDTMISAARQKLLVPVEEILDLYESKHQGVEDLEEIKRQVKEVSMAAINNRTGEIQLENLELEFEQHMPEECPLCGK